MKWIKWVACILILTVSTAALFSVVQPTQAEMTVCPTRFSQETEKVLNLFDDEVQFFDIQGGKDVRSHTISVWVYRDGAWQEEGTITGNVEQLGRKIAVRLTDTAFEVYEINENGHMKYAYPVLNAAFDEFMMRSSTKIQNETALTLNQETVLWIKVGTNRSSMAVMDLSDFRNIQCDAGVAVTLTLSEQVVE